MLDKNNSKQIEKKQEKHRKTHRAIITSNHTQFLSSQQTKQGRINWKRVASRASDGRQKKQTGLLQQRQKKITNQIAGIEHLCKDVGRGITWQTPNDGN